MTMSGLKLGRVVVLGIGAGWLCAGVPTLATAQARADFETPPTLAARDLVPADRLQGPGYRIDDAVPTDGFLATFTVRSDYGVFPARGPGMLEIRLREVAGLRQLEAISKSDAFVEGLKASATEFGGQVKQIVTNPVDTVKAIPEGVGRFFERVSRGAKTGVQKLEATKAEQGAPAPPPPGPGAGLPGASSPGTKPDVTVTTEAAKAAGSVTRDAFGYDDRRRQLAKQIGVDPYTTNPVLAKQLDDIAWAAFAGGLGVTAMKSMVPGSMVIGTSTMLTDWVYDTPPGDLKVRNEKALLAMGVSQDAVDHLLRHRWYTLTRQSRLVHGLERLGGVTGRVDVMPLALSVTSEEQARFVAGAVEMLARYHEKVAPLATVQVLGTVVARTQAGAHRGPGVGGPPGVDADARPLRPATGSQGRDEGAVAIRACDATRPAGARARGWTVEAPAPGEASAPVGQLTEPDWTTCRSHIGGAAVDTAGTLHGMSRPAAAWPSSGSRDVAHGRDRRPARRLRPRASRRAPGLSADEWAGQCKYGDPVERSGAPIHALRGSCAGTTAWPSAD